MKVYGLTGGIASGKSAASARFQALGVPVIDADKVAHEVIEPGGAAESAVVDAFGPGIVRDGRISREALGDIVFRDPDSRKKLNDLTHPAVIQEMGRRSAALAEAGHWVSIIDAALLGEDGTLRGGFAGLILILCPREERLRRLVDDRGMSEDEANRRIDAQTPPEKKIPLAKWVIDNSGTLEELHARIDEVRKEL